MAYKLRIKLFGMSIGSNGPFETEVIEKEVNDWLADKPDIEVYRTETNLASSGTRTTRSTYLVMTVWYFVVATVIAVCIATVWPVL